MKKIDVTVNSWGVDYKLTGLQADSYRTDGTLYLELWTDEEPFAALTVCLGIKKSKDNKHLAFIDTNNFPQAPQVVEYLGIGEPTGLYRSSGFCMYPLYTFDLQKIAALPGE